MVRSVFGTIALGWLGIVDHAPCNGLVQDPVAMVAPVTVALAGGGW